MVTTKIHAFVSWFIGLFTYPVVWLIHFFSTKRTTPPIWNSLLLMSATELAYKIRNKQLKAEDVMSAFIARCLEVNPIINAIVEDRYVEAIADAVKADAIVASDKYTVAELEEKFPLLGVPLSVKEAIAVKGMSNQAGVYNERNEIIRAEKDADSISLMRAAGAIPFIVTNTPELCFNYETFNYVTGLTRNPYDSRKTAGGSSGGEGAILGSGASVIGLGTDSLGSIKLPSMFNGIFCHLPTMFAVPNGGALPTPATDKREWYDRAGTGPMVRYAEDLLLMMKVLNQNQEVQLTLDKQVPLKQIKLYYADDDCSGFPSDIDPDIKEAMRKVIDYFKKTYSMSAKKVQFECQRGTAANFLISTMKTDFNLGFGYPVNYGQYIKSFLKKIIGLSYISLSIFMFVLSKKAANYLTPVKEIKRSEKIRLECRAEILDLLKDDGVCFYPVFRSAAFCHFDYFRHMLDFKYPGMANIYGIASTTVPVGKTKDGLPVGLQILMSPGYDHLGMTVAIELQKAFGGWSPPSKN